MRIGIAAVLGTCGGPRTYARALVEALARSDAVHEYWVLTDCPAAVPRAPQVHAVHVPLASRYAQPWWDHVGVPGAVRSLGLELLHHTKAALPLGLRVPSVVSVYDAAPFSTRAPSPGSRRSTTASTSATRRGAPAAS
ncbi:MAG: hypothetical protein IPK07_08245 [Deltaproteobacteria bacterium]|nr:hypothetical protein [Deltaproteobacteria bacterium]